MRVERRALGACALALLIAVAVAALLVLPRDGAARTERWVALRDAPLKRTEVAAARVGRFVYVVGGFQSADGAATAAVERYDLLRDRWKRVRDMPVALNHATAVAYRGRVYVHGGYAGATGLREPATALVRYEPRRDRWRRLASSAVPRAAHAAAVVDDRLYVAGGANDSGSLRSLEVYSFRHDRWTKGPSFPARRATTPAAWHRRGASTCWPGATPATWPPPSAMTRAGAPGKSCPRCVPRAAASPRSGCATGASWSSAARS